MNELSVAAMAEEIYGDRVSVHIISAACKWVEDKLRKDITEEEKNKYIKDMEYAAAVKAAADAAVMDAVSSPGEIRVGDVAVRNNPSGNSACILIESALENIRPIMTEKGFAFSAVDMLYV